MKRVLLAAALSVTASVASASTVLDFESLASASDTNLGSTFSEDGFTLNAASTFYAWGSASSSFTGSTTLHIQGVNDTATLTKDGGGTFSIVSIVLSELYPNNNSSAVTFVGSLSGGGTTSQTFTLDGPFGNETFAFASTFTNLTSLSWTQPSGYHQFDDITLDVAAVPLPAAFPLLLAALGGLGFAARRRKTACSTRLVAGILQAASAARFR